VTGPDDTDTNTDTIQGNPENTGREEDKRERGGGAKGIEKKKKKEKGKPETREKSAHGSVFPLVRQ
jgi:hypothetical protein